MKLYYAPGACSLAPHIVALEAKLDIKLDKVQFGLKRLTEDGRDYYGVNSKGAVPALELDDGQVLTENAVVLQYLAARAPAANLIPADGLARWRVLELLNYIATELHKGFAPLFNPAITPEAREATVKALGKKFDFLEKAAEKNSPRQRRRGRARAGPGAWQQAQSARHRNGRAWGAVPWWPPQGKPAHGRQRRQHRANLISCD